MTPKRADERTLKLHEEELAVGKRIVDRSRVLVTKSVQEHEQLIEQDLAIETAEVERVSIGREISEPPEIRQDGDVTIIPLVEEVVVVEKRLILREEIRIRKRKDVEHLAQPVTLRSETAAVVREPSGTAPQSNESET